MVTTVEEITKVETLLKEIFITSSIVMTPRDSIIIESERNNVILDQGAQGPAGITEDDMVYAKRVDFISDNLLYKGEAPVGTTSSQPFWRIRKITIASTDSDIDEIWANGSSAFTNIWDNRLGLTYT